MENNDCPNCGPGGCFSDCPINHDGYEQPIEDTEVESWNNDVEADADTLKSAGMGMDEDYDGYCGRWGYPESCEEFDN